MLVSPDGSSNTTTTGKAHFQTDLVKTGLFRVDAARTPIPQHRGVPSPSCRNSGQLTAQPRPSEVTLGPRKLPDTRGAASLPHGEMVGLQKPSWPAYLWDNADGPPRPTSSPSLTGGHTWEHLPQNLMSICVRVPEIFPRKSNLKHMEFNKESAPRED